jgi:hypothetical protein
MIKDRQLKDLMAAKGLDTAGNRDVRFVAF